MSEIQSLTLSKSSMSTIEIKKSKFIGYASPIEDEASWKKFKRNIKKIHPNATHHTYAYILDTDWQRYYDDGEPHGSAGKPILNILKTANLCYTAIIVVRYFGGTKLGFGGLVRAYTQSAKKTIDDVDTGMRNLYRHWSLSLPYESFDVIYHHLKSHKALEIKTNFKQMVHVELWIPCKHENELKNKIQKTIKKDLQIEKGMKMWKCISLQNK